ncbi:MAG: hypothetical protein ACREUG_17800, partial [Steroidobacteraceae bacterium]
MHEVPFRFPVLFAAAMIVAVAAHAGVWYVISRHLGFSGVVASALISLAVVKHLGWIGGAFALLRRRHSPPSRSPVMSTGACA